MWQRRLTAVGSGTDWACVEKMCALRLQVVADIEEPFLPMPDDLVVNLADSRTVVEALLDSLPAMFAGSSTVRCTPQQCLSPAFWCSVARTRLQMRIPYRQEN